MLVILAERKYSPREIHDLLLREFPGFVRDMSTIYRCLSTMEKEGLLSIEWHLPEGGAAKKIYSITKEGWGALEEWKEDIEIRKNNFEVFLQKFSELSKEEK